MMVEGPALLSWDLKVTTVPDPEPGFVRYRVTETVQYIPEGCSVEVPDDAITHSRGR